MVIMRHLCDASVLTFAVPQIFQITNGTQNKGNKNVIGSLNVTMHVHKMGERWRNEAGRGLLGCIYGTGVPSLRSGENESWRTKDQRCRRRRSRFRRSIPILRSWTAISPPFIKSTARLILGSHRVKRS